MGLMATIFSTLAGDPVSFLAAHTSCREVRRHGDLLRVRTILKYRAGHRHDRDGDWSSSCGGARLLRGVMALTIHGIAALAAILEEIEHIGSGPWRRSPPGANLIQTISLRSHSADHPILPVLFLLRWDINMRPRRHRVCGGRWHWFLRDRKPCAWAATSSTQLLLWAVAVVIIIVDYVSERWGQGSCRTSRKRDQRGMRPALRTLRTIVT